MAKTLIIKGANFYGNAVDHVTFGGTIPCTGISIDITEKTLTTLAEQFTITATIVPTNTTDEVVWSSSDTDIVDVNNGVVTMKGIGTANVTVSCGNYSAVCAVTVSSAIVDFKYYIGAYYTTNTSVRDYAIYASTTATDSFTTAFANDASGNGLYAAATNSGDGDTLEMYPIPIPKNVTTLHIRCMTQYYGAYQIGFYSSDIASTVKTNLAMVVKQLYGRTDCEWGDKTYNGTACWGNDITIPTNVTCDGVAMLIKQYGSGTVTEADAQNTHIWFD